MKQSSCDHEFEGNVCTKCGIKGLEHSDYEFAPGMFSFSAWSRENIPKGPPRLSVGDNVVFIVKTQIHTVGQDCDGTPLYGSDMVDTPPAFGRPGSAGWSEDSYIPIDMLRGNVIGWHPEYRKTLLTCGHWVEDPDPPKSGIRHCNVCISEYGRCEEYDEWTKKRQNDETK
jgi:hypothetical protein